MASHGTVPHKHAHTQNTRVKVMHSNASRGLVEVLYIYTGTFGCGLLDVFAKAICIHLLIAGQKHQNQLAL